MGNWIKLEEDVIGNVAPLFQDMQDTCVLTCLQGKMGQCYANDALSPTAAVLQVGDFCFLAGDCFSIGAEEMVASFPSVFNRNLLFVITKNDAWWELLSKVYKDSCKKIKRYGIKKKFSPFDVTLLNNKIKSIPGEFSIIKADERIYDLMINEEWSKDFCGNFESAKDYVQNGLGFVAVWHGDIVAGTSSYTWYEEGYEIEVATKEEFRRKGLAAATSAAFILECQKRGKYPSWDAANMASVHLAESLGYEFDKEYDTYQIKFS